MISRLISTDSIGHALVLGAVLVMVTASLQPVAAAGTYQPALLSEQLISHEGLKSTVFGPPPNRVAELPEKVPLQELNVDIQGSLPVPDLFWFNRKLRVWLSDQGRAAPLVVTISGTGGSGNTDKVDVLRRALFDAGYHVLTLPSPTHPGFAVAASSTGVAGDVQQDAHDLRRVIDQLMPMLAQRIEITDIHLVGYSLGGAHAALIKALDAAQTNPLGFNRAVMINPPVSLFDSVARLDALFSATIGDDNGDIERFYQRLYADIARLYQASDALALDEHFLLAAAARLLRSDEEFAAAVALSFRLALINMFFIGDYYAGTGVVVDPADPPDVGDSLDQVLRELRKRPFQDYFDQVFAPFFLAHRDDCDRQCLIEANSLKSIEKTIQNKPGYFAQTNRDDLILNADELTWLQKTLGERLVVYERGGHLGSIGEEQQISDMLKMLSGRWHEGQDSDREQP